MFGAHKMDTSRDVHPPFGTVAMFSHAGNEGINKTQPRTELGIILGSSPSTRGAVRASSALRELKFGTDIKLFKEHRLTWDSKHNTI